MRRMAGRRFACWRFRLSIVDEAVALAGKVSVFGGENEGAPGGAQVIGVSHDEVLSGAFGPAESVAGMESDDDAA